MTSARPYSGRFAIAAIAKWSITLAVVLSLTSSLWAQTPGTWTNEANLNEARSGHAAAMLPSGQAIIVGGSDATGHALSSAEVYSASTNGFSLLSGGLSTAVSGLTATVLGNGTVLLAGGTDDSGNVVASAQIFDPTAQAFSTVSPMSTARSHHTATILADGRVLIVGGTDGTNALASLEIFDPSTQTFSTAPASLLNARQDHTAPLLADGRVLIAGGSNSSGPLATAELFNPVDGTIAQAGSLNTARTLAAAALLIDGTVLIDGGKDSNQNDLNSGEDYDPVSNTWTTLSAQMVTARSGHVGLALPNNGRVLIAGGASAGAPVAATEVYDSVSKSFIAVGPFNTARQRFGANFFAAPTVGQLLASGGVDSTGAPLASTEMFSFPTIQTDQPDYPPGSQVTFTGAGWAPNENVSVDVHESDNDSDIVLSETADSTGAWSDSSYQIEDTDGGVSFLATAVGATSNWTAQTKFTDAGDKVGSVSVGAQSPAQLTAGNAATYTVTVTRATGNGSTGGFTANLSITTTLPTGATYSFNPSSLTFLPADNSKTATLTITTSTSTPVGTTSLTVQAVNSSNSKDNATGPGTLTVTIASTSLSVASATGNYGGTTNLSATLTSGGNPVSGKSIAFTLNGNPAGSATTDTSGVASLSSAPLAGINAGTYATGVGASFAGDSSYAAASGSGQLTVNPASTTPSISAPTVTYNANGTVTVTVGSTAGTPTGNVSLTVDGGAPITQALSSGQAIFTLTSPNAGDHSLSASYAAQGNYAASSANGTLHVNPAPTTTSINAPTITYNANGTVTVTVSSAAGTPNGNVSLSVDGGAATTQALSGGQAVFTLTSPSAGDHSLSASYGAQGNYAASSGTGTLHVNGASTTVSISAPDVTYNANGTVTVTVSSAAGTPNGNVSLSVDGSAATTQVLSSGQAVFTLTSPNAGDHSLNASYAAQGNYAAGSGTGNLHVNPAPTTISINAPTITYNANSTVTVTVSSAAGTPTGNVSLSVDGGAATTQALSSGQAIFTLTSPNAGDHSLSASYAAQGNYAASSATGNLHVNPAPTTTSILAPTITYNANGTVTVTVSSAAGTPTGNVSLSVDGGAATTQALSSGQAVFTLTSPNAGDHSLSASYAAQGNYAASSGTGNLHVNPAPTTTSINAPTITYNANGTVTVTVSSAAGTPNGNVSLSVDGGAAITEALSSGQAIFTLTSPNAGDHSLSASYAAQGNYAASSATGNLHVNPAPTTTYILAPTITYNANGTVTVTVSSAAGTPTGNVSLSVDGGAAITEALSSGQAIFTLTSPNAGDHSLSATYPAQGNYDTSSATGNLHVNPAPTSLSLAPASGTFGGMTTLVATLSSSAGPCAVGQSVGFSIDATAVGSVLTDGTGTATLSNVSLGSLTVGSYPIGASFAGNLNCLGSSNAATLIVNPAPTLSSVSVTCSNTPTAACQYSDPVTFTASITPAQINGLAPAQRVTFFVGTQNMGTASLASDGNGNLVATLSNVPLLEPVPYGTTPTGQMAPGAHTVTAQFNDVNSNFSVTDPTTTLTIAHEDAGATYTGALFVSTSSYTSTSATVTLAATIQDSNALPTSDPRYDQYPGDIRNATVTFVNNGAPIPSCSNLPVGLVSASETTTGTVTCNWNVNISCASSPCSQTYTIGIIVGNYYNRNSSLDDAVINVAQPGNDFITGGGYLLLQSSGGLAAGTEGSKNNFGFNVKYNKSGTNLQGNINTIVRSNSCVQGFNCQNSAPYVYQVKGNSMTSLSVQDTTVGGKATFNGKASIQDITNPLSPISIDGNATLQVNMTDNGEPGTNDTIGITVWNKSGGMWFSSDWYKTQTVQQNLAGGDLVVH